MSSYIEWIGRGAIVETPEVSFTYEVSETPRDFKELRGESNNLDWDDRSEFIGDYEVMMYGTNNDLPDIIKDVVFNNSFAPGTLLRKTELLYGAGPKLYTEKVEDNRYVRTWTQNDEVEQWLYNMHADEVILEACVEYQHMQGVFSKFETNKGQLIGKEARIEKIHTLQADHARLAKLRVDKGRKPTHTIISDWSNKKIIKSTEARVYKNFDHKNPFAEPNSILYSNLYSFCTEYYTIPSIYGSLEWLKRSTSVPLIFKALSKNSINLKYHIISPQSYWDKKEEEIKAACTLKQTVYNRKMLLDYQKEFLDKISEVLSGEQNVGKYLHTTKSFRVDGVNIIEEGWEIKVIDQNIKSYVDAQIKISERSDAALSSAMNLHPVLSSTNNSGKSNSGSEQIYAMMNYLNTGVNIQEMIILKAFNHALRANWPNLGLKLGFYQNVPEKQQDIAPQDRSLNTNTK